MQPSQFGSLRYPFCSEFLFQHHSFRTTFGAIMASFLCEHCRKETKFLPIHTAIQVAGVSRSAVYYWMKNAWIHWRELRSGRRVICKESLSHRARPLNDDALAPKKISS